MILWGYRVFNVLFNLIFAIRLYNADFHIMRVIFEPLFLIAAFEALFWMTKGMIYVDKGIRERNYRKMQERAEKRKAASK